MPSWPRPRRALLSCARRFSPCKRHGATSGSGGEAQSRALGLGNGWDRVGAARNWAVHVVALPARGEGQGGAQHGEKLLRPSHRAQPGHQDDVGRVLARVRVRWRGKVFLVPSNACDHVPAKDGTILRGPGSAFRYDSRNHGRDRPNAPRVKFYCPGYRDTRTRVRVFLREREQHSFFF